MMELEDQVRFMYYTAQFALDRTLGLHVPNDRIELQVMKESEYTTWVKQNDFKGYHRREAADRIGKRKKQEEDRKQEVGLCEIIDANPTRYRVTVSYPPVSMTEKNKHYWRAVVFGHAAHELAHVWDYENTLRGQKERDGWAAYALARKGMKEVIDGLKNLIPELDMPEELHSYDSYEEAIGQHLLKISHQVAYYITMGQQGHAEQLKKAAGIQTGLINLHLRAVDLNTRNRIPSQERQLQEGWAEYVRTHAMEWFYSVFGITDLEVLPPGAAFAHSLQQLELWKSLDMPRRLGKPSKVEPIANGPYTEGLVKLNTFKDPSKVKAFILKAIKDEELPVF